MCCIARSQGQWLIFFLLIINLFNFRPRTESFMIKQHLTFAVGLTQIVLLLSIAAYRKKVSMPQAPIR